MRSGNSTSPPSPNVKASGGEPMKRSDALRAQHVAAVAVAGRQHVAVEMHGALGLAGGAGGEADQADVVGRGVAGGEGVVAGLRHQRFERVGRAAAPVDDALRDRRRARRAFSISSASRWSHSAEPDLRLRDRIGDLLGAQQRHGRDHHAAGLDHREIGRHHHRVVGPAQQHAVAGHEAEVAREHVGDAVHALGELRVGERLGRRDQAGPVAGARRDPAVEQLGRRSSGARDS